MNRPHAGVEPSSLSSFFAVSSSAASHQGLTLVHFSAQRKRFVWDGGYIKGSFRRCKGVLGGIRGGQSIFCVRNGSG